ncbi:MAG: serine hydrolase domain-containing protein [Actinomycetota bacterium]|nr:serine hydrolase domain-containing protein [Actinomycetota bacterium]
MTAPIGTCDPAFAGVRDAFAQNFVDGLELGASVSISIDGRHIVDLWGGHLDAARTRPWEQDSLVCVFSCTKGVVAIATMWAVARGLVDLDAPVASYWPEFAAAGKGDIPVRWLLTHEAGLPAIGQRMPHGSLSDWKAMTVALAEQKPWWEPGTAHGYHGVTFGHLIGEVLQRATGRDCGALIRDDLAAPLGVELCMPLPAEFDARTADLAVDMSTEGTFFDRWDLKTSLGPRSFGNPPDCNDVAHCMTDTFRRAVIPAANLHSNARGLDRLYSVLACGGTTDALELAPAALVEEFGRTHVRGEDRVMELPTAFGLGFEHTIPEWQFGPGPRTYGHNGSGGSLGIVDPDAGISLGYAMNRLWWGPDRTDPRWAPIFDALYAAI